MPLSKKRKKKGKNVGNGLRGHTSHIDAKEEADISAGVTLQDLINVVAYQEYEKKGMLPHQQKTEVDLGSPHAEAVIRAVQESGNNKVNEENQDDR